MNSQTTYHISSSIGLEKGIHRGMEVIFFVFHGRRDWLEQIKTLADIKYTRTLRKWYIPLTKKSYHRFLKLNIKYHIIKPIGTTEDIASQGVKSDIDSKESLSAISPDNIDSRADIHDPSHGLNIVYNGGYFNIDKSFGQKTCVK